MLDALREQIHEQAGREPTPGTACIDGQSVMTTEMVGTTRGYDGGNKVKWRKRHLLVDILGSVLAVLMTGAGLGHGVAVLKLLLQIEP
jgi:putative transposase